MIRSEFVLSSESIPVFKVSSDFRILSVNLYGIQLRGEYYYI